MKLNRITVAAAIVVATAFSGPGAWAQQAAANRPAQPAAAEYRLGAGDVVRITVYQNPDLTLEGRISEAGTLSYPLLGAVRLGGLTVPDAERRIADGLRQGNFVRQPQVSVLVTQVRGNQASVLGQVNRPGRFPIEAADLRLSDLLAMAGGVATTGADVITVVGTRDGRPFRREIDVVNMFRGPNRQEDLLVLNGDVVYVERAPMIYIYGEVQRPGAFRLERDMTVMQGLATGGGLTQRGTERGMRVHRRGPDGKVQVIQPAMDERLRDGDVIYVRESIF
jgi:polysaccharide export outer membrane protein